MKKILLISIFLFCFIGLNNSYAIDVYYNTSQIIKNCSPSTINNNNGTKQIISSSNYSVASSGYMNCIENNYYSGQWSSRIAKGNHYNCPHNGYASSIQRSGNSYRIFCKFLDNTPPVANDISGNGKNKHDTYIIANESEDFSISVSNNGGSPIASIVGKFEQVNNASGRDTYSSTSSPLTVNANISNVDLERTDNGYRDYSFEITSITDQAGNKTTEGLPTYTYHVYASWFDPDKSGLIGTSNFTDGNVANGIGQLLKISLKDQYDNSIVPVPGVSRNVNVDINYTNNLFLNQYEKNGGSAVFATSDPTGISSNIGPNTQTMENDTDGIYEINYRVYAPTYLGYNKAYGGFSIDNIKASVTDVTGDIGIGTTPINFKFSPIYKTTINSELKTKGFIEGATQTGTISIYENGTISPQANLYLEFGSGGTDTINPGISPKFNLNLINPDFEISGTGGINYEGYLKNRNYQSFNSSQTYPLNTLLTQTGVVNEIKNQYLSSHIGYTLNGKNILYNSDIIGKENYWSSNNGINTEQIGLKVLGVSYSKNQSDITTNQNENDIHIIGNINKTNFKNDIRKNVYDLINQVVEDNGNSSPIKITDLNGTVSDSKIWDNNSGVSLLDKTVLYFGNLNGENVILDSSDKLKGKKTIIIIGGNLYIKSNIINDSSSDILGIIVLKDENNNGGNIYIDPNVTEIDSIMYVDKSLISYDGFNELDGNTTQYILRNQLYIKGSVFSENTIGGSRVNPPVCPYYVSGICNIKTSQKYDLNFLRRYYIISGNPINGGISVFPQTSNYYNYPVVIKYNSLIQKTPPPIFEN